VGIILAHLKKRINGKIMMLGVKGLPDGAQKSGGYGKDQQLYVRAIRSF